MPNAIKLSLLAFTLLFSSLGAAAELTEASIHKMIATVDRGIDNQSADEIGKVFSNSANITLHISAQGQSQSMTMSKSEYIAVLRQTWGSYDDYKYKRSGLKIALQGKKAFVTDTITETIRVQGQHLTTTTKEEVTIELVNGTPLITNVVGYTYL